MARLKPGARVRQVMLHLLNSAYADGSCQVSWQDGERVLCRGRRRGDYGDRSAVLCRGAPVAVKP
jgi:hypothetical protein